VAFPVRRIDAAAHESHVGVRESARDDVHIVVSKQNERENFIGPRIGDAEIPFVGLIGFEIGARRFVDERARDADRASAQTCVLNRSPMGLSGGESSACQVK